MTGTERKPLASNPAFMAYYREHLEPLAGVMEKHRVRARAERTRRLVGASLAIVGGVAVMLLLAWPLSEMAWWFGGFALLVTIVCLGVWAFMPTLAHYLRLKDQVLPRILPYFGDLEYQADCGIDPDRYRAWGLLPNFNKSSSEDQVRGSYRGVPLSAAEVKLQQETWRHSSSGSDTRHVEVVFKGLLCDFQLARAGAATVLFGSRGMFKDHFQQPDEGALKPVAVDDRRFEIFADDEAAAHERLPPEVRRSLAGIADAFSASRMIGSFHDDRLVLLIEHEGDYFELPHHVETDFIRDAEVIRGQLDRIFGIVDTLALEPSLAAGETVAASALPPADEVADQNATQGQGDPYHVGGWGCLHVFVVFAVLLAASAWFLRGFVSNPVVLALAAPAAFFLATAGFMTLRALRPPERKLPIGGMVLAVIGLLFLLPAAPLHLLGKLPGGDRLAQLRQQQLATAVKKNDLDVASKLLWAGVARVTGYGDPEPPMIEATDSLPMLRLLLESGLDPDVRDHENRTALMFVRDPAAARLLLEHGADPQAQDRHGNGVLYHAASVEIENLLLEAGARRNPQETQ